METPIVDRPHFSPWLLWSTEHQAALAREIEDRSPPRARAIWIEHRAYVLSAVVASVAFSEAFINELYQDVDDRAGGRMHPADWLDQITRDLPDTTQERMRQYWASTRQGRRPAIEKYRHFLGCCDTDMQPGTMSDLHLLAELRNEIVHYRPSDHFTAPRANLFETELRRRRVPANPLAEGSERSYWTERALSAGLAEWGVRVVSGLADEVSSAAGLKPSYAMYKRGGWFDAEPGSRAVERFKNDS